MSTITIVNKNENLNNASAGSYKQLADKAMFQKWKGSDEEAWGKAFEWMFGRFYHRAFITCRAYCQDDITAEQMAVDALYDAFFEIDKEVKSSKVEWRGEQSFYSLVWRRVYFRCIDEVRKWLRQQVESIFTPIGKDDEEETLLIDVLPNHALSPEEIVEQRERVALLIEVILALIDKLTRHPRWCQTVSGIFEYIKMKLAESVEHPNPNSLSVDELLDLFNLTAFHPEWKEMYQFLIEKLGITRDVLYQRMNDIRNIAKKEFPDLF